MIDAYPIHKCARFSSKTENRILEAIFVKFVKMIKSFLVLGLTEIKEDTQ